MRITGLGLIAVGLWMTALAAIQFARHRTSIIPGRQPDAMITAGLYRLTRNPIYLADALILTGACLWLGAISGLLLVPGFIWLIQNRFIRPEEQRLQAAFGPAFDRYRARVRRWL